MHRESLSLLLSYLVHTNTISFRNLLSLTQKAHFKSSHMQKIHLALDVYRGLGAIPITRHDTLTKVSSMLLHPFPKVCLQYPSWQSHLIERQIRITAAECLWVLTQDETLKLHDWSLPPKTLKPVVDGIKTYLSTTAA